MSGGSDKAIETKTGKQRRVVAVGIDGGELSVLRDMIRIGMMPNLAGILDRGAVIDIDTAVEGPGQGWASFITGKSPVKHGVFYWTLYKKLVNSRFIKDRLLWEILGEHGIKGCVLNMSYTHPPKPFNGYMISGLGSGLNPADKLNLGYPVNLMAEIKQEVGDYIPACDYKDGTITDHLALIDRIIEMTRQRTKASLYIMEKYTPQFVLSVFRGADLIQHCYWNLLDPDRSVSPHAAPLRDRIRQYYAELDRSIALLFRKYGDSCNVIVSDHGFGAVQAIVYLNNYLESLGLLARSQKPAEGSSSMKNSLRAFLKTLYIKRLKKHAFFRNLNRMRKEMEGVDLPIDMDRTSAYSDVFQGVMLNKKAAAGDANNLKRRVIEALESLRDPQNGSTIIRRITLKEDSYARNLEGAPDIIFEFDESYLISYLMPDANRETFRYMNNEESAFFTGSHRKQGMFVLDGIDSALIDRDREMNITDAFATILDLFGAEIPADCDGRSVLKLREPLPGAAQRSR